MLGSRIRRPNHYIRLSLGSQVARGNPDGKGDMNRLRSRLLPMGFIPHDVRGDGNCQFRAISHQIFGDDRHHANVRRQAVHYIYTHRDRYVRLSSLTMTVSNLKVCLDMSHSCQCPTVNTCKLWASLQVGGTT